MNSCGGRARFATRQLGSIQRFVLFGFSFFALILVAAPVAAQSASSRGGAAGGAASAAAAPYTINADGRFEYRVAASPSDVRVDGILDEAAWLSATRVLLPFETNPGDNTAAPVDTECLVTFSSTHLYFGCTAEDPDPSSIRAYITDRDDIAQHDRIVMVIDPFNDARRAFEFGISALGVQFDAVSTTGQQGGTSSDASWDAIWNSAGRTTSTGYTVEASIPFKSLRFPSTSDVQTWGFYAARYWPRSQAVEARSMRWDRQNSCVLCQTNLLTGFQGISPGRNLEFTPTLTSGRTDSRADLAAGELVNGSLNTQVGVDALWGITTDLTLNLTANPDFSQVEADAAQLDVNNRFGLFFAEKRPFFLEGADFFQTPINAVFTRTIVDPTVGTKVTGKMGSNAVGVLIARDEVTNLVFPSDVSSNATSREESVTSIFGRFRRDFGASSTVGALYTGREGDGYFNRVGGVDALFRPFSAITLQIQALHSETEYPTDVSEEFAQPFGQFGGDAVRAQAAYNTRNWNLNSNFTYFDDGFRTDAGFVNQVNMRNASFWGDRRFWAEDAGWYTVLTASAGAWHNENLEGRLIGEGVWASFNYQGPGQSSFWINPNFRSQFFSGETHDFAQYWAGFSMRPSGSLGFGVNGAVGSEVDFLNGGLGDMVRIAPNVDVRIGRGIDLSFSHTYQRLSRDAEEIFTANLTQVRAVYNFNPRTFVRAIVQYRDTNRNPDMNLGTVDRSRSNLFTQLLFSYKVNPQTVFFLGYADTRAALTDIDFQRVDLTQASRSLFLKLGYAIRP